MRISKSGKIGGGVGRGMFLTSADDNFLFTILDFEVDFASWIKFDIATVKVVVVAYHEVMKNM